MIFFLNQRLQQFYLLYRAFSSVGSLEGQYFKATGKLAKFSEQNLEDCVYGTVGTCKSGRYVDAFKWVNQNGIMSAESYPYFSGKILNVFSSIIKINNKYIQANGVGGICKYNQSSNSLKDAPVTGWTKVSQNPITNELILKEAVSKVGPISVGK
jgi:hypothetical protein